MNTNFDHLFFRKQTSKKAMSFWEWKKALLKRGGRSGCFREGTTKNWEMGLTRERDQNTRSRMRDTMVYMVTIMGHPSSHI